MGNAATGAQTLVMLGLEQQVENFNTGVPLPFTVAADPPGIATATAGAGTGITHATVKYGIQAWIAGRGLTAIGTKSTPALDLTNDSAEVSWTALAEATGCYGYRVCRTVDDGVTWIAIADVWGRTVVAYTDTTPIGSEPELDGPLVDETTSNAGLVQFSASVADYFHREDGEFESDEITGELGEPDAVPGFQTYPQDWPFDLRAGKLVPIEASFSGEPVVTFLTGAPGAQYDFGDEDSPVSAWAQKHEGGSTRPVIGTGIRFFDMEFGKLGTGLAECKVKGIGTGYTECGIAIPPATVGTYLHVPVVKGQRGDAGRLTTSVFVKIIDAPAAGVFTFKAKIGAGATYGGSGTLLTGYYSTTTGKTIMGGLNEDAWIELVDETGEVLGIDADEQREPFSIAWPGDCRLLEADKEYEIPAQALIPRALKSVGDTTSTGDVRRIIRLPRFGPAQIRLLKTVDSVQSRFEFESITAKFSRTGTPAYPGGGASALRPSDVDVTGYVAMEFDIDSRFKTREVERMRRENVRFALALEIVGGRIASAPGVLSTYRESVLKTFSWCRIASFSAVPGGTGVTKSKVKIVAAQPPDGSSFMPLNRIISKQTWPFHAI